MESQPSIEEYYYTMMASAKPQCYDYNFANTRRLGKVDDGGTFSNSQSKGSRQTSRREEGRQEKKGT